MGQRACLCCRGSDGELSTGRLSSSSPLPLSSAGAVGRPSDPEAPPASSIEFREARDALPLCASCKRSIPDASAEMQPHPEVRQHLVRKRQERKFDRIRKCFGKEVTRKEVRQHVPARKDSNPVMKAPRDSSVTAMKAPVRSTTMIEKDRLQTLARTIDGHYHTEMSLQHRLTVIDTVVQSIDEAGSEIQAEQLLALVNEKADQCHLSLQEAYKTRLEARRGAKEDSMQKANSAHRDAFKVVESLFKPCGAFADISEVRKAAKAKYNEVFAELDQIGELKLPVMEELANSQESHMPILEQLRCFADGAVQMAMANPQHAALRYCALRAVVRHMRMSDGIAGHPAPGGCRTKEWRDFAEMALSDSRGDPRWDDTQRDACTILGRAV